MILAQTENLLQDAGGSAIDKTIDTVSTSRTALVDSFNEAWNLVVGLVPNLIAAFVILVVGYIVARLLARGASMLCETIGLQRAAERSGLSESMKHMGISRSVPAVIGLIVFWLLMAVAIMAGFRVLGLTAVSDTMQEVVNYIPNLLVATVVVVIGLLVAGFLRGIVATSADRVGLSYADTLANACYYVLALMTLLVAAGHLGLQVKLLETLVLIAFGAAAAGFALAFGLGGRDVMGGILAGYYLRQRFQAGDHVRLGETEGTVREVGPVATIIESEEEGLLHRRSVPNHLMLKEAIR